MMLAAVTVGARVLLLMLLPECYAVVPDVAVQAVGHGTVHLSAGGGPAPARPAHSMILVILGMINIAGVFQGIQPGSGWQIVVQGRWDQSQRPDWPWQPSAEMLAA